MKFCFKNLTVAALALFITISALAAGAVSVYAAPESLLTGSGDGTFTVASMNVDGLPESMLGTIEINPDGPGAEGSAQIGGKLAASGWDIIGISEDFNYHNELCTDRLKEIYSTGTYRGEVGTSINFPFNTDGLELLWKKSLAVTGEKWVEWNTHYPTSGWENGGDHLVRKGFRFYQATIADGVTIDVYILHMDAGDDSQDIAARESQLKQLASYIKSTDNKNPIIIMGDTNCRYTRDNLKSALIESLDEDSRFMVYDAWVEAAWGGVYPTVGSSALMASDKTSDGSGYSYPKAEIVDKIFFLNNFDSNVYLRLDSYTVDTSFTYSSGEPLSDHWPVTAKFTYAKKHTVTYEDGVGGSVFAAQTTEDVLTGSSTPGFNGTPKRDGYQFDGWSPSVSETVTEDVTYTAVWRAVSDTPATDSPVTDSNVTTPSTTEPPETDPSVIDPFVTEPPVTEAPVTDASELNPDMTDDTAAADVSGLGSSSGIAVILSNLITILTVIGIILFIAIAAIVGKLIYDQKIVPNRSGSNKPGTKRTGPNKNGPKKRK